MLGPLFRKELIETSRRRRYYAIRVVTGLFLLAVLWWTTPRTARGPIGLPGAKQAVVWNGTRWVSSPLVPTAGEKRALSTAALAQMGVGIFHFWSLGAIAAIFLLTPAMVSGLIAGEKDAKTFEILLTTPLEDREILIGKLASRLFLMAMTLVSSVPILALASWYGGFSNAMIVKALCVHGVALIFTATLAIYYSTITRKPYVALVRSYVALGLIWFVLPSWGPWLLRATPMAGSARVLETLSPIRAVYEVLESEDVLFAVLRTQAPVGFRPGNPNTGWLVWGQYTLALAAYLGAAAFLFYKCKRELRREKNWVGEPWTLRLARKLYRGTVGGIRGLVERRQHWAGIGALWKLELKSRSWGKLDYWLGESRNPLVLRNSRANVYDPERYLANLQLLLWLGCLGVLISGYWVQGGIFSHQGRIVLSAGCMYLGLVLLIAVLSASAVARERQYGSWDILLLTPITGGEFLWGTCRGLVRTIVPTIGLVGLAIGLMTAIQLRGNVLLSILWTTGSALLLVMAIGLTHSLHSQRMAPAIGLTLLTAVVPSLMLPFVYRLRIHPMALGLALAALVWFSRQRDRWIALAFIAGGLWLHAGLGGGRPQVTTFMPQVFTVPEVIHWPVAFQVATLALLLLIPLGSAGSARRARVSTFLFPLAVHCAAAATHRTTGGAPTPRGLSILGYPIDLIVGPMSGGSSMLTSGWVSFGATALLLARWWLHFDAMAGRQHPTAADTEPSSVALWVRNLVARGRLVLRKSNLSGTPKDPASPAAAD